MVTAPEWIGRLPRRRRGAIPLADAAALRLPLRRTTIVRFVLVASLLALTALAVWRAANLNPRPVSFLPENSTTVLVIDQSKSIFVGAYRRIAGVLRRLVRADVPVGLVAFSDTAYEMLPPGTSGADLRPLLRFYTPSGKGSPADPTTQYVASPWDNVFSAGTRISSGLDLAQSILHRDGVRNGTILLLSDLETASEDQPALAQTLLRIERDRTVRLKIAPLFPIAADQQFFSQFVSARDFVKPRELDAKQRAVPQLKLIARTPWPLLIVGGFLLLALAANELFCSRLRVVRVREEPA